MPPLLRLVVNLHIVAFGIAQHPLVVLVNIGSIHHEKIVFRRETLVNQKVIYNSPVRVEHHSVKYLSGSGLGNVIGENMVHKTRCVRTVDKNLSHVGDIEHSDFGAYGNVLRNNTGRIADRHIKSGEGTHHGPEGDVRIV